MSRDGELWEFVRFAGHHGPAEGFALVFVAYLDDSDDRNSRVTTLAGYMAHIDGWKRYEAHSRAIYDRFQIGDVLHTKEFYDTKPPFKDWSRIKKLGFVDALFDFQPITYGVAVSVDKVGFKKARQDGLDASISPLGFAFSGILHRLIRGNPFGGMVQAQGLSLVVEAGHNNNGDIERVFARDKKMADPYKGVLRSLTFSDKHDTRALHLADLLAFYARRWHSKVRTQMSLDVPADPILQLLTKKVPTFMNATGIGKMTKVEDYTEGDVPWLPVPLSFRPKSD